MPHTHDNDQQHDQQHTHQQEHNEGGHSLFPPAFNLGGDSNPNPIQRQETINMPPTTVTAYTGDSVESSISNLDRMRGQGAGANSMTASYTDEAIERNTTDPSQRLPFNDSGWDANEILNRLGQYDRMASTDSDSQRCVQAVAIASRIPRGPDAVISYIGSITLDAMMSREINDRRRTALNIIDYVKQRIENRQATYGDMSWLQEAVHDYYYDDVSGTPDEQVDNQIQPTFEALNSEMQSMDVWCNNPGELMTHANALNGGEQLVISKWQVVFNTAFDQVAEQGFTVRPRMQVEINGRLVWIRQIRTDTRPDPNDIDLNRDTQLGHQLLIIKENNEGGALKLYEPEVTVDGNHLITLDSNGGNITNYFTEQPAFGIYNYVHIRGKIVPNAGLN